MNDSNNATKAFAVFVDGKILLDTVCASEADVASKCLVGMGRIERKELWRYKPEDILEQWEHYRGAARIIPVIITID